MTVANCHWATPVSSGCRTEPAHRKETERDDDHCSASDEIATLTLPVALVMTRSVVSS